MEKKAGKRLALAIVSLVLLLAGTVAAVSWAQSSKQVVPYSVHSMEVVGMSEDSLVTIKDHGDSQTVMVFQVNKEGKIKLTDKKKFFY